MSISEGNIFPTVKKSITNFLYEEEANISRSKMLTLGSMMIIVSVLMINSDVFARHGSHGSHSSHSSHASHSSGSYTPSHVSHESHVSHASHVSSSTGTITPSVDPTPGTTTVPQIPTTQIPQIPQDTPVIKP